jgi:hypothetical protein
MVNYYNRQPVQYPLPPTPTQGRPHFTGLQMPNYFQGHNLQTGNMYIPANNNLNQQLAQVPNTIPQTFLMPAATTSAQQSYQTDYFASKPTQDTYTYERLRSI